MTEKFQVSVAYWPLATFVVGNGMGDPDYEALLGAWEGLFARQERFVTLTDSRGVRDIPNAAQRAKIAAWKQKTESLRGTLALGQAIVISNPLLRGAMTAIGWLHKPAAPQAYFSTVVEACDWCIERLRGAGLAVAPAQAYRTLIAEKPADSSASR